MSQGSIGDILELRIIVRYNGVKATQYFSKFTPESDNVFRDDLAMLKLPHPKRENTVFISHGLVECFWPAVQRNGVLHKHILNKAQPSIESNQRALEDALKGLSIAKLTLKSMYPDTQKRKNLKRPNPNVEPRAVAKPVPKPPVPPKTRPEDAFRSATNPYPLLLDYPLEYLAPSDATQEPPRPYKVAKTREGVFQLPSKPAQCVTQAPARPSAKILPSAPRVVLNSVARDAENGQTNLPRTSHFAGPLPANTNVPRRPQVYIQEARAKASAMAEKANDSAVNSFLGDLQVGLGPSQNASGSGVPEQRVAVASLSPTSTQRARTLTLQSAATSSKQKNDDTAVNHYLNSLPGRPTSNPSTSTTPATTSAPPTLQSEGPLTTGSNSLPMNQRSTATRTRARVIATPTRSVPYNPSFSWVPMTSRYDSTMDVDAPSEERATKRTLQDRVHPVQPESVPTPRPTPPNQVQKHPMPPPMPARINGWIKQEPTIEQPLIGSSVVSGHKVPQSSLGIPTNPKATQTIRPSPLPTPPPSAPFVVPSSKRFSVPGLSASGASQADSRPPSKAQASIAVPLSPPISTFSPPTEFSASTSQVEASSISSEQLNEASSAVIMKTYGPPQSEEEARSRPRLRGSDLHSIQRLTRESWDVKRQVAANVAREAAIIEELKSLNSLWIPDPIRVDDGTTKESGVIALRAKLEKVEQELENERRLRKEAEDAIRDVRRECKAPFIVPSLLDAFVQISKLTTRATTRPSGSANANAKSGVGFAVPAVPVSKSPTKVKMEPPSEDMALSS